MINLTKNVSKKLQCHKFSNVKDTDFTIAGNFTDFFKITRSWENMGRDEYYGQSDKGTRYRRYSDFEYHPQTNELRQLEHRAYVQSTQNNSYVGGIERHFSDFSNEVINSPLLRALVQLDFNVYKSVLPEKFHNVTWQCQIHQIRIEVKPKQTIEITPEGIHCDGYPFSAVHFWGRENIDGAMSQIFSHDGALLVTGTYKNILDTTFFLDRELQHYVTPATNTSDSEIAYRQIIAISFSLPGSDYDVVR